MQKINLKVVIIILIIIIISTIGLYILKKSNEEQYSYYEELNVANLEQTDGEDDEIEETKETQGTITIHITGAVNYSGVVVLEEGARVVDAIAAAGGEKSDADLNKLNLAYVLNDGEKIYVPSKNEQNEVEYITSGIGYTTSESTLANNNANKTSKININTATVEELITLPGIGEATANKIITYRKENGKFEKVEDLKNVAGIGDSKLENIKDLIIVK